MNFCPCNELRVLRVICLEGYCTCLLHLPSIMRSNDPSMRHNTSFSQRRGDRLQLPDDENTEEGQKDRKQGEGGSLTVPVAIISILLIIHRGLKFSTDNRPRLSWRAAAVLRHGMWRRPQNSCSGLPTPESSVGQTDTACPAPPPLSCAAAPTASSH